MSNVYPLGFGHGMALLSMDSLGQETMALDSNDDKAAWVFQAHDALTITRLAVYCQNPGAGTSPTYRVSLQSVNSSGEPSGTILGGGSPASGTTTLTQDTWSWVSLSNSYACSRGQLLAVVIDYSSGTIDGSNYREVATGLGGALWNLPYPVKQPDGGGWSKSNLRPIFGYGTAGAKYGYLNHAGTVTVPTSGTGLRVALKFTLPSAFGNTFKVAGFRISMNAVSAEDFKIGLWDGTTELQAVTITNGADGIGGDTGGWLVHEFYFDEATLSTLNYGSAYRVGVEQLDASDITVRVLSIDDATPFPYGANGYLSSYNGGSWGDDTSSIPFIDLILEDTTPPGGSGGGLRLAGHGGLASC